jgi:hypothetical protein
LIVHVVLRLATNADDPHSRRDAFSALALMRCCRRLLAIIEASDEVWEAMVAAELFSPTTVGAPHPARERLRRLRQLSLTGFWAVSGQYATGETYSYEMQLCDFSNTRIWPHLVEDGHAQPILLPQFQVDDEHTVPVLKAHFARAGLPEAPLCDGQRSNWLVGDVAGPWPMRIVAKAVRNMIVFNEVCSDDSSHGRWVNLCSAVVSEDGKRMEGVWMQARARACRAARVAPLGAHVARGMPAPSASHAEVRGVVLTNLRLAPPVPAAGADSQRQSDRFGGQLRDLQSRAHRSAPRRSGSRRVVPRAAE